MQPFIGPPIPINLLAATSGWMHVIAVALVVFGLATHIFFYVWIFRFLNQWGKDLDERRIRLEEREHQYEERKCQRDDENERLRETIQRVRAIPAKTAS